MELKSDSIEANASTLSLSLQRIPSTIVTVALSPSLFTERRRNGKGDAMLSSVFLPTAAPAICPDLPE